MNTYISPSTSFVNSTLNIFGAQTWCLKGLYEYDSEAGANRIEQLLLMTQFSSSAKDDLPVFDQRHTLIAEKNYCSLAGDSSHILLTTDTPVADGTNKDSHDGVYDKGVLIGNADTAYHGCCMRIYSCQIYDGDTLIRDFVPAREIATDICGLYDAANDKFYTKYFSNSLLAWDNYWDYTAVKSGEVEGE